MRIFITILGIFIGLASSFGFKPLARANDGNSYAFLVGIKNYQKSQDSKGVYSNLPYSENDLINMRRALIEVGFKSKNVVIYSDVTRPHSPIKVENIENFHTDEQLSAKIIRKQLVYFIKKHKMGSGDNLFVYLTGHGVAFKKKRYFVSMTSDTELLETYVSIQAIAKDMANYAPKARKLLVLDGCATPPTKKPFSADGEEQALPGIIDDMNLFFSSENEEPSRFDPSPDVQMSVFTYYFINALKLADGNRNAKISIQEIFDYLNEKVPQHPVPNYQNFLIENKYKLSKDLLAFLEQKIPQKPVEIVTDSFDFVNLGPRVPPECMDYRKKDGESEKEHSDRVSRCLKKWEPNA